MELVLLQDVQSSFGSNWARIANTTGVREIQIGDRFREQGFGPGAEELEVAGVDISPVGGMSRLFFNRGGNATKPEVHRLGAVLEQVGIKVPQTAAELESEIWGRGAMAQEMVLSPAQAAAVEEMYATAVTNQPTNTLASVDVPLKRGRGRPKGSLNKKKAQEVVLPVGFS